LFFLVGISPVARNKKSMQQEEAMLQIKRVYEPWSKADGERILIDRLWPRGLKKENVKIDEWMKNIAPSNELRTWFSHDPKKWSEFKRRFFSELEGKQDLLNRIVNDARKGTVTLLFGAKDDRFNNASALKEYVETRMQSSRKEPR